MMQIAMTVWDILTRLLPAASLSLSTTNDSVVRIGAACDINVIHQGRAVCGVYSQVLAHTASDVNGGAGDVTDLP